MKKETENYHERLKALPSAEDARIPQEVLVNILAKTNARVVCAGQVLERGAANQLVNGAGEYVCEGGQGGRYFKVRRSEMLGDECAVELIRP